MRLRAFSLLSVRIVTNREDFSDTAAGLRSAGFQTCCVADFQVGRTNGSRTGSGFGNPRHSRLGSPRYFGCGFAPLRLCVNPIFVWFARMKYRELGRTGWKVSEISFGAWAIGGIYDAQIKPLVHQY